MHFQKVEVALHHGTTSTSKVSFLIYLILKTGTKQQILRALEA